MGRLRTEYIETGKVRFVYKQFPILGPQSTRASEASECAAEQDQFWAYHDSLFANPGGFTDAKLINLAGQIGLDSAAFEACLASGRYTDLIANDAAIVQSLGVRGTPGFVINGKYMAGAQSYEAFQKIIEQELLAAGVDNAVAPAAQQEQTPDNAIEGLVVFDSQSQAHQDGEITYTQDAPPGGAHSADWQNCGIYDEPVAVETTMHSLEHGAAWIAYQPNLPAEQVDALRKLVRQELAAHSEPMIILAPKADLDAPIVATAWQVQLKLDNAQDPRLAQFLQQYQVGPYTPEPGAPCSGGVGEPLG